MFCGGMKILKQINFARLCGIASKFSGLFLFSTLAPKEFRDRVKIKTRRTPCCELD